MSAEKCGTPMTVEMVEAAAKRALQEAGSVLPIPMSPRAYRMLKKIRIKFPDFDPKDEAAIWIKAHKMGLTEDE